jgi:hypothetical protein
MFAPRKRDERTGESAGIVMRVCGGKLEKLRNAAGAVCAKERKREFAIRE